MRGSKNENFEKIPPKPKRASKNWILNMCHMSPKKIFKKGKILSFFKKGGLRGLKNENFEKIPPKPKRASKIGY